jgi:predicted ATP-grasp superfamily ATP-dependent carboligase
MEKMFKSVDGVIIELTQQEVLQVLDKRKIALEKIEQDKIEKIAKEEQEIANKQSALNKLKALGLNDAEIKSIIG